MSPQEAGARKLARALYSSGQELFLIRGVVDYQVNLSHRGDPPVPVTSYGYAPDAVGAWGLALVALESEMRKALGQTNDYGAETRAIAYALARLVTRYDDAMSPRERRYWEAVEGWARGLSPVAHVAHVLEAEEGMEPRHRLPRAVLSDPTRRRESFLVWAEYRVQVVAGRNGLGLTEILAQWNRALDGVLKKDGR